MAFGGVACGFASLVYTESYGMSVGSLSLVTTILKCIDFLVGFVIGSASDACRSSWGRRKPFIAIGAPVCAGFLALLVFPPQAFIAHSSDDAGGGRRLSEAFAALAGANLTAIGATAPPDDLVPGGAANSTLSLCEAELSSGVCGAVKQCVEAGIASGALPDWQPSTKPGASVGDSTDYAPSAVVSASIWLTVWYGLTYGLLFSGGATVANIPYAAAARPARLASQARFLRRVRRDTCER
eukprot:6374370-Prymnesium_polylepis.1